MQLLISTHPNYAATRLACCFFDILKATMYAMVTTYAIARTLLVSTRKAAALLCCSLSVAAPSSRTPAEHVQTLRTAALRA